MAVIYTATVDGNSYGFDFVDKRIDIDASLSSVSVGDLWDAIQDAQASTEGIPYDEIATAEGLTTLSTGVSTFLTVAFNSTWEINTLLSSGKFEVNGGNLVRVDNDDPFRDNPLITYINNLSQAGVVAIAETGTSGLTPSESAQLSAIASDTNELQTDWADGGRLDTILDGTSTFDPSTDIIENGKTYDEHLRVTHSVLAGKRSVSGSTETFRDDADSKNRVTATTDENNQRLSVTTDGT